jgi:hypothetical protein
MTTLRVENRNSASVRCSGTAVAALLLKCFTLQLLNPTTAAADPIVRVEQTQCTWGGCVVAGWSGTVIGTTRDGKGLVVLSCAHGYDPTKPVRVTLNAAVRDLPGTILAHNPAQKLSLIRVTHAGSARMAVLADADPPAGVRVKVGGCGNSSDGYRVWETDTTGVVDTSEGPGKSQCRMLALNFATTRISSG